MPQNMLKMALETKEGTMICPFSVRDPEYKMKQVTIWKAHQARLPVPTEL